MSPKRVWLWRLSFSSALVCMFVLGLAAGAYYHREITVVLNHLRVQLGFALQTGSPTPSPLPENVSTISFTQLHAPLPLVYSETLDESKLQEHLKSGAVVLPLGVAFGEAGNVVVTAHSSGTAAFGPYRFAFAKLGELTTGQGFQVNTPAATYTYRVYGTEIVWPHEVDKLPNDDRSTVTLVTCWPLWTNFKRLLVHSELVNVEYKI